MSDPFTVDSVSISGAPTITFRFHGDTCRAELAGASLYIESRGKDDGDIADLRLTAADGFVLANLVINSRVGRDSTENIIDIGSALLWSHWRHQQAESASAA